MEEFFTRQVANEGVKLPLFLPDGTPSEHWLNILGVDSDVFRRVESEVKRRAIEFAQIGDPVKRAEAVRDAELECIAALISDWSFDKPCIMENKINFLREAPQIADKVNQFAARRSEFFAKKSKTSVTGQKQKSSSRSRQKARK